MHETYDTTACSQLYLLTGASYHYRALEIGCGSGYVICSFALALRQAGLHCCLLGTDINPKALEATAATLQAHQVHTCHTSSTPAIQAGGRDMSSTNNLCMFLAVLQQGVCFLSVCSIS